jgi:asparagine synthase (glutamine-hydrolysing)
MLWSLMTDKSLPRLLRYEDRNSMRFQIEARTPFADDRELIESVFSIPSVYKIHNGFSKWLLREAMRPFLPQEIYTRKDKIGFATPELSWFRANSGRLKTIISDRISDYVDVKKITADWDSLLANQPKFGIFCLWRVINLAMWLDVSA